MGDLIKLRNSKPTFSIKNKTETDAEILLYAEIGEDYWNDGSSIGLRDFVAELNTLPSTITNINLRINSPGGSVFDGMAIYERLKQHKAKVTVYIDGVAASIASVIALAGDEIHIGEGGLMMIHKPSAWVGGNADDMERMIEILDKIETSIVSIYKRRTGLSDIEISQLMLGDGTWFTAEEAVESGFAHDIMDTADSLKLAASMVDSAKWIKNKPNIKVSNELVKGKLQELKKDVEDFLARK